LHVGYGRTTNESWVDSRYGTALVVFHSAQTDYGAHLYSCLVDIRSCIPGVKRSALETDISFPYGAEVKMCGALPSSKHMSSWLVV